MNAGEKAGDKAEKYAGDRVVKPAYCPQLIDLIGAGGGVEPPRACKARQILSLWNPKPISANIPPISTNAPDFSRIHKHLQAGRKSPDFR